MLWDSNYELENHSRWLDRRQESFFKTLASSIYRNFRKKHLNFVLSMFFLFGLSLHLTIMWHEFPVGDKRSLLKEVYLWKLCFYSFKQGTRTMVRDLNPGPCFLSRLYATIELLHLHNSICTDDNCFSAGIYCCLLFCIYLFFWYSLAHVQMSFTHSLTCVLVYICRTLKPNCESRNHSKNKKCIRFLPHTVYMLWFQFKRPAPLITHWLRYFRAL